MRKTLYVTHLLTLTICVINAYKQECAIGPGYWCKSFQNAQDCGALKHCTDTVWRYNERYANIDSSVKCEWCEKVLENTHRAIENVTPNQELIRSLLSSGCRLLPIEDISSKCVNMTETYETTVLLLMKYQRYDKLCSLMDICPISVAKEVNENIEVTPVNSQSKILCNIIVRATKELHANHQKTRSEIQTYLKNDCKNLSDLQIIQNCQNLIERRGNEIYAHVVSRVELSKICDYIDHSTIQSVSSVNCELCTFVLSNVKYMFDTKQAEDKILIYIDEQICSRLTGVAMKNCQKIVGSNGKDFLSNIQNGIHPMLLCTHFQQCHDEILDAPSSIQKNEMRTFLLTNLCNQLGSFKDACEGLINKDGTRLLQIVVNDIKSHDLCYLFGLCQQKTSFANELTLRDDPNKCKRCIADFTRRKHIAERLVNHSSEFLHHLCGQLPDKDDCLKTIDESINELVTFIRSMDPRDICVQLNMCDPSPLDTIETTAIVPSDNAINENIIEYMKNNVCTKAGSLSALCIELVSNEAMNFLNHISQSIDPHRVCSVIDVCPINPTFINSHDKCQECNYKTENYQARVAGLMQEIVANTRVMCDQMPGRTTCLESADTLEINMNNAISRLSSQHVCRSLSLCAASEEKIDEDQCKTCENQLSIRQARFRKTINQLASSLVSSCVDTDCRSRVQSTLQQTLNKMNSANEKNLCQRMGYCILESSNEPSTTLLRLRSLAHYQSKTLDQRLKAHSICFEYGPLMSICEHLLASSQSQHYSNVYMALLENNPRFIDDDLREQMTVDINAPTCDSCKSAVESSKDLFNNALDSVLNALLVACDHCPVKDQCRNFVNQQFNNIKSYVNSINADQFCQSIHLCVTSSINHQVDLCSQCMEGLQAQNMNDTESKRVCIRLGYCNVSSLCKNMGIFQESCEEALAAFTQSFKHDQQTLERHLPHTSVVVLSTKTQDDLLSDSNATCILCEYAMEILSHYIHENSTEQEIEESLQKVCNRMPSTIRKQCLELVDDYSPVIISMLLEEFDAKTICQKLNLCTKQMKVYLSHLTKSNPSACSVCDYVSTYIRFALKRDSSEKSLEHALVTVCTRLSNEQQSACQTLVQLFRTQFRTLKLDLNNNFCRELTMCQIPMTKLQTPIPISQISSTQNEVKFKELIQKNLDSTPECTLCHYVISYLDAILKNNKSEAAIEAALSRVCTLLPRKERTQCNDFVKNYGPVLADLLAEMADPDEICRYLGMCQVVSSRQPALTTH